MIDESKMVECPRCLNKTLLLLVKCRKNYPFGRQSKHRLLPIRVKEVCTHEHVDRRRRTKERCDYKTARRLAR